MIVRRPLSAFVSFALCMIGVVAVVGGVPAPAPALALDNGLARTPQMGFNNWNATHCDAAFDEDMIKSIADLFVSQGLKDAGYEYVNIDDCWAASERDPLTGRLVPDPVRFPNGIKALADYVHARGLKFGIYTSAGTRTCANTMPGGLDHEAVDAQTFADWGVDYLKYDNCNNEGRDAVERYTAMRDALAATGRPILYSIVEWGQNQPWLWAGDVGNSWRTTGDIGDSYASMLSIVHQNMALAQHAGPGRWNDPDMLEIGNGGMTDVEYRSHFSLWSIMAAPLLIGTDLRDATPETLTILRNREVIAVDQDRLGAQGAPIAAAGGKDVFVKPLANGDRAIALFNETDTTQRITTTASAAGLPTAPAYRVRDLWAHTDKETAGTIAAGVPPHGTVLVRVSADPRWAAYPPAVDTFLDVPTAYPGAPTVIEPGATATVRTTVTNAGRLPARNVRTTLTGPDGWIVRAASPPATAALGSGAAFTTTWTVRVPSGVAAGSYELAVRTAYRPGRSSMTGYAAAVEVVNPPPGGTSFLSDVPWLRADNGWGPVEKDTSNGEQAAGDGHPITIEGTVYAKGLGAHAPGSIEYYVAGHCSAVSAQVGVDDEKSANGSVTFELWADGDKVADSGPLTVDDAATPLAADLSGAAFVRLVATDAGDGTNSDHADWADAKLTCS
jgi:alpha-galactosidase